MTNLTASLSEVFQYSGLSMGLGLEHALTVAAIEANGMQDDDITYNLVLSRVQEANEQIESLSRMTGKRIAQSKCAAIIAERIAA